ncbi:MAG TPA: heterodisulfide reductase-related iron-sulfur binding cluster [Myxococcales bacterium]|nr:heterodisulfide reductase-related iron-sulfur binding cluster [Myxococcales bacterium]
MPERKLIDDCVHCGFCLPACPTYHNWNEEMDSPRGRIYLMKGLVDHKFALNDTVLSHFDRCLGCMACVTACPSGVRYDVLIEEQRAEIEAARPRGLWDRLFRAMIFALFPYPARLRAAAFLQLLYVKSGLRWLFRALRLPSLLPARLTQLERLMPDVTAATLRARLPEMTPASGARRARVALLAGCVQRVYFPEVNAATIRVLAAEGCEVLVPRTQGCCGALSLHAGRDGEAKELARALIGSFPGDVDAVVVNAAGCGSHLKDLARLLPGDARAAAFAAKVRDVTEFLAALPPRATRHPLAVRAAYHDACHLRHAQRIVEPPRQLLRGIPGLTLVELTDSDLCCGSAGVYNLVEPQSARQIGERKVTNVLAAAPELLVSANPGCTLQIQSILRDRGVSLRAAHPIEVLDASIRGGAQG